MKELLGIVGITAALAGAGLFMLWFCDSGKFKKGYYWYDMDKGDDYEP